jgi:hypothetical protein
MAKSTKPPEQPDFLASDNRWSKPEKDKIVKIAWQQSGGNSDLCATLIREHCSGGLNLFETEKK